MTRLGGFVVSAAVVLVPLTGVAASPSPSPSLDAVLAPPPSGFTPLTASVFNGHFTAHDYASLDPSKTAALEDTLNHDGFVDGYGLSWVQQSAKHALVEAVMAFSGGAGARKWLQAAEVGDKKDPTYKHADTLTGVQPYYGGHFEYTNGTVGDVFSLVKGNDVFIVGAVSGADDVLDLATTQAKAQYDKAPDSTIPSAQWPENASANNSPAYQVGQAIAVILVVVFVLAVVALAVGLVVRNRRRPAPALGAYAAPAVDLSPDGKYWYDGQGWRDASVEVPPTAQRSGDGSLWWDGRTWRPVPQSSPTPDEPHPGGG